MTFVLFDECCQVQEGIESRKRPGPPGPVASSHAFPNANCFAGRFSSLLASGEAPESGNTIKVLTGLVLSGHAHDASTYLKIEPKDLPLEFPIYNFLLSREFSTKPREKQHCHVHFRLFQPQHQAMARGTTFWEWPQTYEIVGFHIFHYKCRIPNN